MVNKSVLAFFAFSVFLSTLAYVHAQSQTTPSQFYSFIEIWHVPETADNRTVKFFAAYAQNSTGLLKLINDGTCRISFSDNPSAQNAMAFVQDAGYGYSRKFAEPAKISYTVSCSHVQYPQQQQTKVADIIFEFFEVGLLGPASTVKTRDVNFICEARGTKPDIINLYTDTSGDWKLRASASIPVKGSKSPYRVNFKEEGVADGDYSWNCEAQAASGNIFASKNQSFRVRFSPNTTCSESIDCGLWRPETCPSSGLQARACNNTSACKYQESRKCTYISESGPAESNGVTLIDEGKAPEKTKTAEGGGPGILTIFLIIVVIAGGAAAIILIRKRKSGKKEEKEDEFGKWDEKNEDFEEEGGEEDNDEK